MSREKQTPAPIRSSAAEVLTYVASTGDPQGLHRNTLRGRKHLADAKDDGAAV